jgi:hypothetical protein
MIKTMLTRKLFEMSMAKTPMKSPSDLETIIEEAIELTIDTDAYNEEIEREEKDSQFLEAKRKLIMAYAGSLPSAAEEEMGDC